MGNHITEVVFRESDNRYGNREAVATLADGSLGVFVIAWFDDELTFKEEELINLTVEEARDLRQDRDTAYLQSHLQS